MRFLLMDWMKANMKIEKKSKLIFDHSEKNKVKQFKINYL